ncbi:MAG: putative DNA-binding domain-containing protein [Gammaproteobacteria bacterium]
MSGAPAFRDLQYRFAAHLRDPCGQAAPDDVDDRRVAIYRGLLYRNVEGFMANAFPVLRQLIDDERWHALIRDYFARHRAHTPLFPKMPQEFLHYLAERGDRPGYPPFMRELAHYEWLEAEVLFDTREIGDVAVDAVPDLAAGCPVVNPLVRPQAYVWPVQRIGPDYQPDTAPEEPTYLAVYRRRDDGVGFMALNAVAARLLQLVIDNPDARSGQALLAEIARELAHPDPAAVIAHGLGILETFLARDIILGSLPAYTSASKLG